MKRLIVGGLMLAVSVTAGCASGPGKVIVPASLLEDPGAVLNASLESGQDGPANWRIEQCEGSWSDQARTGRRSISVTGDGKDHGYWRCSGIEIEPRTAYRFSAHAKASTGTAGGCMTMGLSTNNRDSGPGENWMRRSFVLVTPDKTDGVFLRCGQWQVAGTVCYDDVSLRPVMPTYAEVGGLVLGDGERVVGGRYVAEPNLKGEGSNEFRGLVSHTAGFNSFRWVFGPGGAVTYVHRLGQVEQTSGKVTVSIGYYQGGELLIEAGKDGRAWTEIGRMKGKIRKTVAVPASLLPTKALWVRLRATGGARMTGDSSPGSFQVYGYRYEAALAGDVKDAEGRTSYVDVLRASADPRVVVTSVKGPVTGDPLIGGHITSAGGGATLVRLMLSRDGKTEFDLQQKLDLAPGKRTAFRLPFTATGAGEYDVTLAVGDGEAKLLFAARTSCALPILHSADYGYAIESDQRGDLWWCEGTHKVSKRRPAPRGERAPVRITSAGNEYEPFQLVLRPKADLKGVRVAVSDLRGPVGRLDNRHITVDRVAWVSVTTTTDAVGCIGDWPDPLPRCDRPFDVPGNTNQPIWITVHVPKDTKAGTYQGAVTVTADGGVEWQVPISLRVLGFSLPKAAHIFATFGLNPSMIRKYHNLETDEELRKVYDLYMQNFAAHRIGPYNPMALDPIKVTVKTGLGWSGGLRDKQAKASGSQSIKVVDDSATVDASAETTDLIPVDPKAKYILTWKAKTAKPGQEYMLTVCHRDANRDFISHHNTDIVAKGTGKWASGKREFKLRSSDARFMQIVLRPTRWTESHERKGTTWYDDVSFKQVGSGRELLDEPGFEATAAKFDVDVDFSAFDRAAKRYLDDFGFQKWRLPIAGMGSGTFHSRREGSFGGFAQGTPEYEILMSKYLGKIQAHMIEKGWMDKPYAYWFDEPTPKDYQFVKDGMAVLKRHAPRLTRMLTEQPEPAMMGSVDLWCPVTSSYSEKVCRERQAKGEHVMWYVCTGPKEPYATLFTDHPAIDLRMWLWQTYKYDVEGLLVWESNYWSSPCAYPEPNYQNPWEDAMSWRTGYSTPIGTRAPWGNGDGRFVYPPNIKGAADKKTKYLSGPINSIRWEMLREGIEDFEYLWQLRHAVRTLKKRGVKGADIDRAERLTVIPRTICKSMTEFTWDPKPLYEHREQTGLALEGLIAKYGLKIRE